MIADMMGKLSAIAEAAETAKWRVMVTHALKEHDSTARGLQGVSPEWQITVVQFDTKGQRGHDGMAVALGGVYRGAIIRLTPELAERVFALAEKHHAAAEASSPIHPV